MQLGPYRTEKPIEIHNDATLYTARHQESGGVFLLTVVLPDRGEETQRWQARLDAVSQLQHPNILSVATGQQNTILYAAVPRLPTAIPPAGELNAADTLKLSEQVSAALDYAHSRGLVHGQLGLPYIVQQQDGTIVVRGFELGGIAADAEPADDVAALVRLVYRALTGNRLEAEAMPGVPPAVADVLRRALGHQFAAAGDFHAALVRAMTATSVYKSTGRVGPLLSLIMVMGTLFAVLWAVSSPRAEAAQAITTTATDLPTITGLPSATDASPPLVITATNQPTFPTDTPTITMTPTQTFTPAPDVVIAPRDRVNMRSGPGMTYAQVMMIKGSAALSILGRTADSLWLNVRFKDSVGWVAARFVHVNADLSKVPIVTSADLTLTIPPSPIPPTCIDVVGDSVAHGSAVFEIPQIGFMRAPFPPVSKYIEDKYRAAGNKEMQVFDRSVSAVGISSPNHPSYFDTPDYQALLKDHCGYTIIVPWINDVSAGIDAATAAPMHAAALAKLASAVAQSDPDGKIFVLNFYRAIPTNFAIVGFAAGYTDAAIATFNQEMQKACGDGGALNAIPQASCLDISAAFAGMDVTGYVVGSMTGPQIEAAVVSSILPDEKRLLDYYISRNASGLLRGDGVHLSDAGKTALASYLYTMITAPPPTMTPTPTSTPTIPPTKKPKVR